MFDVFTEEIEVAIKNGIANLYWYKGDLHKAWLRSGVQSALCDELASAYDDQGNRLTKRQQMDRLYQRLREGDYNRRLEISRNFVRVLIEQKTFVPQNEKHRIEIAERSALKLKDILATQEKEREYKDSIRRKAAEAQKEDYHSQLFTLRENFIEASSKTPQERGYAFEKIFAELMRISQISVEESFRIAGEQIDGGIKYDGHYYLVELKWTEAKADSKEIGSFIYKVEGKFEARGIMISMNGYTDGLLESLPKGKKLQILLLDGNHIANVIFGHHTIQELLEHAISQASLKGNLYCSHNINA